VFFKFRFWGQPPPPFPPRVRPYYLVSCYLPVGTKQHPRRLESSSNYSCCKPQDEGPHLVGCPRLFIKYISNCLPYLDVVFCVRSPTKRHAQVTSFPLDMQQHNRRNRIQDIAFFFDVQSYNLNTCRHENLNFHEVKRFFLLKLNPRIKLWERPFETTHEKPVSGSNCV
jgi:hypothetical protein